MARQGDLIALALTGAIIGGLFLARRTDAAPAPAPTPTAPFPPFPPVPPTPPTPPPGPPNPAEEQALTYARTLITQALANAPALNALQREALAQQLDVAALQLAPSSPTAAAELRTAAQEIRKMSTGAPPPAQPPAQPPPAQPPPGDPLAQYDPLRRAAEAFLADQGPMDAATLAEMDRVAAELARANRPELSAALVDLATRSYQKLGLTRPVAMRL